MGSILWLASYPKSGNTWVRAFIHNLFTDARTPFDINEMSQLTHGDSNAKWFFDNDGCDPTQLSDKEIGSRRFLAHQRMSDTSVDSVLVKTHNAMVEDGGKPMISNELTGAAIYIVRNPLDVVVSYADHLGVSIEKMIEGMATKNFRSPASNTHVPEIYCDWSTHVKSWTQIDTPALHIVKYEDMKLNPNRTFSSIANFMGLTPSRDRLRRAIKFSSFKVLQSQEKRRGFIERTPVQKSFFRKGSINGWRTTLSKQEVKKITEFHKEQMERFDYIPEDL